MIYTSLKLPRWIANGIKPNHKGARVDKYIYGGDSETLKGHPMSFQFYSEDVACDDIFFVNPKTAMRQFFAWCDKRRRKCQHVIYVHHLEFDLPEFLWGAHEQLGGGEFEFTYERWRVSGVYGAPTFCRITDGHGTSIQLVDSLSWFRGSLAKAAELFCPGLPKLRRPRDLGEKQFKQSDAGFVAYAMRDSVVAYHMGKAIEAMHKEFDLQQCVSVADMAARIFRHHYLDYTIPQPSRDVILASLYAYHGGKNNTTVKAGWYPGVTGIDISSAYPKAMHDMPAFSRDDLYKRFRANARVKSVPEHGVYCITGRADACSWPVVFSHEFKPIAGKFAQTWIQGFEVNEGLRSGELHIESIKGHYYDAERDLQAPALRAFCAEFYERKERETDKVRRYMWKLILNSISGKFIQTRRSGRITLVDIDAGTVTSAAELTAGGMFHPFIAASITAHTRSRIHQLEHKYKALHTATDGIMTQSKSAKAIGHGLGAITVEAQGELLLIRNKLYILYSKKGKKTQPSYGFKGKHIAKFALHGFQGTVTDLERLVASGRRKYNVNKPNRLKESLKGGLTVNEFRKRVHTLKIGAIPVR